MLRVRMNFATLIARPIEVENATRASTIVADALVLILTWAKTFKNAREAIKLKLQASVTILLIRDGTVTIRSLLA